MNQLSRKILHVDMDAFYASVEQRDRPELRGRPLVVGGDPQGRGVVAAASYEARKFGIRSAMSAAKAARLCPTAIFVHPDFSKYKAVSQKIREIFHAVTPLVEPLSLDEAYLDVTTNLLGMPLARDAAVWIKKRIREETGLTASAGAGPNKFIAKIASDLRKPDGLVVVPPEKVLPFIERLPVEKLWGVGPATATRLHELGLKRIGDIRACSRTELEASLGKFGLFLHDLSNGIDDRQVDPGDDPKSSGTETTFDEDVYEIGELERQLDEQASEIARDLRKMGRSGRTVTLKLRYEDFTTITRSRTLARATQDARWISQIARELLREKTEAGARPVRLIGITLGGLADPNGPEQLWFDFERGLEPQD